MNKKNFWMWRSVFGVDINISDNPEDICEKYGDYFHAAYFDGKLVIISMGQKGISWQFPMAVKISNLDAYKIFGIEHMEEAKEKTYSAIY